MVSLKGDKVDLDAGTVIYARVYGKCYGRFFPAPTAGRPSDGVVMGRTFGPEVASV